MMFCVESHVFAPVMILETVCDTGVTGVAAGVVVFAAVLAALLLLSEDS